MNKKIIVASNNEHKIKEIKEILNKFNIEVKSQKDENINIEVEETGKNFMENAYLKAKSIYEIRKDAMVLADDSGLMVDALDGAPGIYSARFAGEHGNSEKNNEKLLELLKGEPNRNAKFVCSMVLIVNDEKIIKVEGSITGTIIDEEKGENGFGYDPLFYVQEYKKTFAQMDSNLKNSISHRGKALNKLEKEIQKLLQEE